MGALIHVISDALNNIGVIIAALVIMLTKYEARFYADPGVSLGISLMILLSSIPLVKNSGKILMQSAPRGVDFDDVKHDLEKVKNEFPLCLLFSFSFFDILARSPESSQSTNYTSGASTSKRQLHPPTSSCRKTM